MSGATKLKCGGEREKEGVVVKRKERSHLNSVSATDVTNIQIWKTFVLSGYMTRAAPTCLLQEPVDVNVADHIAMRSRPSTKGVERFRNVGFRECGPVRNGNKRFVPKH